MKENSNRIIRKIGAIGCLVNGLYQIFMGLGWISVGVASYWIRYFLCGIAFITLAIIVLCDMFNYSIIICSVFVIISAIIQVHTFRAWYYIFEVIGMSVFAFMVYVYLNRTIFEKIKQYKILEKWIYIAGICGLLICELLKIVYTIRNNMTIEAKLNVFNILGFILSVVGTIGLIGMWYSLYPNILKNVTCKNKVPEENTIAMLKECKKLLDEGIITEEEFEIQKAELLK